MNFNLEATLVLRDICESVIGMSLEENLKASISEIDEWDSLAHVEIILIIESKFQISLPENLLSMNQEVESFIKNILLLLTKENN